RVRHARRHRCRVPSGRRGDHGRELRRQAREAPLPPPRDSLRRRRGCRAVDLGGMSRFVKGPILGWDVGGANLKAARIAEDDTSGPSVFERPFPLWRDPHRLPAILREAADCLGTAPTMAVTTTAELADCFATKREGVAFVLDAFRTAFPAVQPWDYSVDGRFRSAEAARQRP